MFYNILVHVAVPCEGSSFVGVGADRDLVVSWSLVSNNLFLDSRLGLGEGKIAEMHAQI